MLWRVLRRWVVVVNGPKGVEFGEQEVQKAGLRIRQIERELEKERADGQKGFEKALLGVDEEERLGHGDEMAGEVLGESKFCCEAASIE